jgi:hypothetical protein
LHLQKVDIKDKQSFQFILASGGDDQKLVVSRIIYKFESQTLEIME